jgi:hypothetical protein
MSCMFCALCYQIYLCFVEVHNLYFFVVTEVVSFFPR